MKRRVHPSCLQRLLVHAASRLASRCCASIAAPIAAVICAIASGGTFTVILSWSAMTSGIVGKRMIPPTSVTSDSTFTRFISCTERVTSETIAPCMMSAGVTPCDTWLITSLSANTAQTPEIDAAFADDDGERTDLLGGEAEVARRLLEEGAGAGGALVVEAEAGDAAALVEAARLHRLPADVEHRARVREEVPRPARLRREIGHLQVAEGDLGAPLPRTDDVRDLVAFDARRSTSARVERLPGGRFHPESARDHGAADDQAVAREQHRLRVGGPDVDPGGDHLATSSRARARSSAKSAAPRAPM